MFNSSNIGEKIRTIRESLNLGRHDFSIKAGLVKGTLTNIETGRQDPSYKTLEAITNTWPQYALWLMTGETIPDAGQISPEIEETRIHLKQGKAG